MTHPRDRTVFDEPTEDTSGKELEEGEEDNVTVCRGSKGLQSRKNNSSQARIRERELNSCYCWDSRKIMVRFD